MSSPRLASASLLLIAALLSEAPGRAKPSAARPRASKAHAASAVLTTGATFTFPYRQKQLLYSRNAAGGLAYVTSGATRGSTLPVVVFLHGMNADEQMHMWFGPPYGDLRTILEPLVTSGKVAPFILAAPTHTRFATAANVMWPSFDLADFLGATERALGGVAHVDRLRVIVVGHSGAGCNTSGGLLGGGLQSVRPMAVLAVDTCVDDQTMPELAALSNTMHVRFFWQRTWPRRIADLEQTCAKCRVMEVSDMPSRQPHAAILPEALRRTLPELLPPP